MFPNLLIIGAMKSGSTSLHNMLNAHPEIHMSEDKELNYFIKELNYSKGEEWYSSNFKEGYKYNGESSIGYTKKKEFPGVAKRIYDQLPDAKLIYIVREPIERSVSHYLDDLIYMQNDGKEYPKINDVLTNPESHVIQCSSYSSQLEEYLNYFKRDQILILKFEMLKSSLPKLSRKICEFLDIEPIDFSGVHSNRTGQKQIKSTGFKRISDSKVYKTTKALIPPKAKEILLKTKLMVKLTRNDLKSYSDDLEQNTIEILQSYFYNDLKRFEELSGTDFSEYYSNYSLK